MALKAQAKLVLPVKFCSKISKLLEAYRLIKMINFKKVNFKKILFQTYTQHIENTMLNRVAIEETRNKSEIDEAVNEI